ncbi:MAG: DUF433 domain-containing protein [Bacteroidota bacterium]|nr:DUF433 domain-containing protein [Bacteroidota bacterium]
MEYQLYKNIVSNPDICNGKPTIRGTRITVQSVMSFILAGDSDESVLKDYPRMTSEDLQTCKEFTSMLFEKPTLIKSIKIIA